jgi:hypothetical protein
MNRSGIELNIDELIVRGIPPRDRERFLAALKRELTRLLSEGGLASPRAGTRGRPQSRDDDLAAQVARDIYQGLPATGRPIPYTSPISYPGRLNHSQG